MCLNMITSGSGQLKPLFNSDRPGASEGSSIVATILERVPVKGTVGLYDRVPFNRYYRVL